MVTAHAAHSVSEVVGVVFNGERFRIFQSSYAKVSSAQIFLPAISTQNLLFGIADWIHFCIKCFLDILTLYSDCKGECYNVVFLPI